MKWRPIEEIIEEAKSNDGWIGRMLFAKEREWGWEFWVGQCDAGEWWLGREGNGSCYDSDIPTHGMPLPDAPNPAKPGDGSAA